MPVESLGLKQLVCHLPDLVCHLPDLVCHLPDLVCHLPDLVCHLVNLVCHLCACFDFEISALALVYTAMSQRIADILSMAERLDLAQRLQVLAFLLDRGVPTHEHADGTRVNLSALGAYTAVELLYDKIKSLSQPTRYLI
jgi:hypothetical protein